MGNVYEYLIDGVSGLAPSSMEGACLAVGAASGGDSGEPYLLGPKSDVADTLGSGELVDLVNDIFATGGQNAKVIAVPLHQTAAHFYQSASNNELEVTYTPNADALSDVTTIKLEVTEVNGSTTYFKLTTDGVAGSASGVSNSSATINFTNTSGKGSFSIPNTAAEGDYWIFTNTHGNIILNEYMAAISSALEQYQVEFVIISGASDATTWTACQAKAEEQWNLHRPVYFKCAARMPEENEGLSAWVTSLTTARSGIAARFVQVCAQFGKITDKNGGSATRNWAGLQAGRTLSNPVQRAAGRVKDGPISQGSLPSGWNDAIQSTLESAGFLTAKVYPGLDGCYWGDSRTLAAATSDYQYEEVVRVVFKAMRLARMAALNSMYDELGDPALEDNPAGLAMLKANIENNLGTMTEAIPKELAAYVVEIPAGQDFVNNGVAVEITLIGIPIIRQIKIYGKYVYAGSKQDPRME